MCTYCHTMSCYVCRSIISGYEHFDQSVRPSSVSSDKFLTISTNSDTMVLNEGAVVQQSAPYGTTQRIDTPRKCEFCTIKWQLDSDVVTFDQGCHCS